MRRMLKGGLALALVAVAGLSATTQAKAETVIRMGLAVPDTPAAEVQGAKAFRDYVNFKSGGELKVELFFGTLGAGERELTEMTQQGALEMSLVADGAVTGFYKPLQVFAIPYLFPSSAVAWEFFHHPVAAEMQQDMLDQTGIRTVVWAENGFRNMTNSKKEVKSPDDMKGLKMRTMESPVYMRFMESLGAAATPISFAELVMSLQQGVVDGQENASPNIYENGMADVQKFMSTTEHIYSLTLILINDTFYKTLTPDQQKLIMEGGRLYASLANALKVATDRSYVERIRDEKGLAVHITTAEEKEMFRKLSQEPVREYITEQVGKEIVDKVLGAVEDAKKAVY
jgi:TRAP-type transport system periplasmic protein